MSAYKDIMAAFSEFGEGLEEWVGLDLIKQDKDTFAVPPDIELRISDGRLKLLVGHATNVLYAMLDNTDSSDSELRDMYRYLFVCLNCQKYRLDPKAAKEALNIEEYENKYWRKQA